MKNFSNLIKKNKIILTVSLICGLVVIFSRCMNATTIASTDVRGKEYAGSQSCVRCHNGINNTYQHTAHFRTSRAVKDLPANWFPKNRFSFNDSVGVSVEKRDSGIFQVEYIHGKQAFIRPFHIAIGSGDEAASFGYWQRKKMYQLPLTYFAAIHGWANSPGFPSAEPFFNRPILVRCFECHSSFMAEDVNQTEGLGAVKNLDPQSIIYGIDCERCHGPAVNHVNFHTQNPSVKEAKYIATWKSFSRQQKLDACAVCHSGNDIALQQSTFSFHPGDTLANYYFPFSSGSPESDVHGKQFQLLASSRCFQMSKTLECSTCHSPHKQGPKDLSVLSAPCINCHKNGDHIDCPVATSLGPSIQNNCIDCHMPYLASKKINIQTGKQESQSYLLHTHRIAIYPEESKKMLSQLKGIDRSN